MVNQWWVTAPWGENEPGKGRESVPAWAGLGCAQGAALTLSFPAKMGTWLPWRSGKQIQVIQSRDGQKKKRKRFLLTEGLELTLAKKKKNNVQL